MKISKIEIKTNGTIAEIFADGHELKGVRSYELTHSAGGLPILRLDLNALNVSVDGDIVLFEKNSNQEMSIEFGEK